MRAFSRSVTLIVAFVSPMAAQLGAADTGAVDAYLDMPLACRQLQAALLLKPEHVPGACFLNSGELARLLRQHFAAEIDLSRVNILAINDAELQLFSEIPKGRDHASLFLHGNTKTWGFHAVLEYDGWVVDLDLRNPKPERVADWFTRHYPKEAILANNRVKIVNDIDRLKATYIGAEDFLRLAPRLRELSEHGKNFYDFHIRAFRTVPLRQLVGN